jgi:hypothetical protein
VASLVSAREHLYAQLAGLTLQRRELAFALLRVLPSRGSRGNPGQSQTCHVLQNKTHHGYRPKVTPQQMQNDPAHRKGSQVR